MRHDRLLLAVAVAAATGPALLAYNVSPSPTFLNQALALALWGWFVLAAASAERAHFADSRRARCGAAAGRARPAAAVGAVVLGLGALPSGLALSAIGLLLATVVLLLSGAAVRAGDQAVPVFALFCMGWVVAGVLSAAIGMVQVFAPDWPDGDWIARSGLPGRAVGNLRQPNHLSSLLLWAAIAVVALLELGRLRARRCGRAVAADGLRGGADRRRAPVLRRRRSAGAVGHCSTAACRAPTRALLLLAPLVYALAWGGHGRLGAMSAATPSAARRGWPKPTCRARASASGPTRWR